MMSNSGFGYEAGQIIPSSVVGPTYVIGQSGPEPIGPLDPNGNPRTIRLRGGVYGIDQPTRELPDCDGCGVKGERTTAEQVDGIELVLCVDVVGCVARWSRAQRVAELAAGRRHPDLIDSDKTRWKWRTETSRYHVGGITEGTGYFREAIEHYWGPVTEA